MCFPVDKAFNFLYYKGPASNRASVLADHKFNSSFSGKTYNNLIIFEKDCTYIFYYVATILGGVPERNRTFGLESRSLTLYPTELRVQSNPNYNARVQKVQHMSLVIALQICLKPLKKWLTCKNGWDIIYELPPKLAAHLYLENWTD